jgi:hypothetical protein
MQMLKKSDFEWNPASKPLSETSRGYAGNLMSIPLSYTVTPVTPLLL